MLPFLLTAGAAHAHPSGALHGHPTDSATVAIVAAWLLIAAVWASWTLRPPSPVRS